VPIDEQHCPPPDGRQVEVGHAALSRAAIRHEEAALARTPVDLDHRDARGAAGVHCDAARDHAGRAQAAAHEAPVRVVAHGGEGVGLAAEARGLRERVAHHAAAGHAPLDVAAALGAGVEALDHVEMIDDAQPETHDPAGTSARGHGASSRHSTADAGT
jgi:hypothetical protein